MNLELHTHPPVGVHPPLSNINQQHDMIMKNEVTRNVPRPISLPGMMEKENIWGEQTGSFTTPGSPVPHPRTSGKAQNLTIRGAYLKNLFQQETIGAFYLMSCSTTAPVLN